MSAELYADELDVLLCWRCGVIGSREDYLSCKANQHKTETVKLKKRTRRAGRGFEMQWSSDWRPEE